MSFILLHTCRRNKKNNISSTFSPIPSISHGFLQSLYVSGDGQIVPFHISTKVGIHHPNISSIFSLVFNAKGEDNILFYKIAFEPPPYTPIIRQFIQSHYEQKRLCCEFPRREFWELVQFVFNKHEMEVVVDSVIRDQSGEMVFENVKCVMYSNKFNIFCFEISDFSPESVNDWDNAFLIPIAIQYFHGLKKAYHNTCLSVVKHGNRMTIFSGEATIGGGFVGPDYSLDLTSSADFGCMIGALIQYSDTIYNWKHFEFFTGEQPFRTMNIWREKHAKFRNVCQEMLAKKEKFEKKQMRKAFSTLKIN